jgi:hypothetical protein
MPLFFCGFKLVIHIHRLEIKWSHQLQLPFWRVFGNVLGPITIFAGYCKRFSCLWLGSRYIYIYMSSWLLILYCYINPIFSWLHHHIHYIGSLFVNPQGLASCLVTAKAIPRHSCSFSYASIKASLAATVEIRWRGSHGFTVPLFRFKWGA